MTQDQKKFFLKVLLPVLILAVIFSTVVGGAIGYYLARYYADKDINQALAIALRRGNTIQVTEDSAVVDTVDKVSPSVVSIIISKDLPVLEQYNTNPFGDDGFFQQFFGNDFNFNVPQYKQNGTAKQEVGGGSGFIVSADGYIVTNKHVVSDESADYTVLTNDGQKYSAKVLARDPSNDIAVLKIDAQNLTPVELGDSASLKVGQSVIAIGNALGEFRNTVSTGVISGLSRSVTAGGLGIGAEQLSGAIQTDASINPGNSGGPLLNIAGQVIGINTAMAQGAQNIGFAIPINDVKSAIDSVKQNGRIVRPWLGIRYAMIDKQIAADNKLSVDYGALIVRGQNITDLAVIPGSPADKAGLAENDIILEVNGTKVDTNHLLINQIQKYNVGDTISLKVLHKGKQTEVKVKLEEAKN